MVIVWAASTSPTDQVVADAVRSACGDGEVRSGRLCPVCASSDHGRPWATHAEVDVSVSLARAGGNLVVVVAPDASAVGVDVEESAAVERHWSDTFLGPGEAPATPAERLGLWVAKEAILKARGTGLRAPLDQVVVADFDGELIELDAPDGFGAALALRR